MFCNAINASTCFSCSFALELSVQFVISVIKLQDMDIADLLLIGNKADRGKVSLELFILMLSNLVWKYNNTRDLKWHRLYRQNHPQGLVMEL